MTARPRRTIYDVSPSGEGDWKVKRRGTDRADSVFENKQDAVDRGRELAKAQKPGQLVIHKSNGKIQTEHTYEKDPYPPKG